MERIYPRQFPLGQVRFCTGLRIACTSASKTGSGGVPSVFRLISNSLRFAVPVIVRVFEAGYMIGDRVLRPASVVVAKGGPKVEKGASAQGAEATGRPGAGAPEAGNDNGENGNASDPSEGA